MHDSDALSTILSPFKIIPLKSNSKMPISSWVNQNYSVFDFLPGGNRAIVIGNEHCVLDVEGPSKEVNGLPHIQGLIQAHGDLPETLSWKTPSGGEAYLFSVPQPIANMTLARTVGLELRSGQHYHLIPDSVVNGKPYEWETIEEIAEIPDWLLTYFLEGTAKRKTARQESGTSEASPSRLVLDALNFLNPTCDYEQWVKIGMASKAAGLAFEAWKAWSLCGENACKDETEYLRKWQSFTKAGLGPGTLIRMAREQGYEPPKEEVYLPVPKLPEERFIASFPEPDGLLKELKNYFIDVSKQEQYALGAALFCMNVVTQRSYDFVEAPQNSYHVFIGETGSKKSTVMSKAFDLLRNVDESFAMHDPRSVASFKKQLAENPSRALAIDEIGQELLRALYSRNSSHQTEEKWQKLLEMHGRPLYLEGHGTAKKEDSVSGVLDPRISFCATGTHSDFEKLLGHADFVNTGLFSRLVVWRGLELPPERFVFGQSKVPLPRILIDKLKKFHPAFSVAKTSWEPRNLPASTEATQFMADFKETAFNPIYANHTRARSLIERSFYQGIQFSFIHAIGRAAEAVELLDAEWGLNVALQILKQSLEAFQLYEQDQVDRLVDVVIEFLNKHGPKPYRNVQQNCKAFRSVDRKTKTEVYNALKESGKVRIDSKTGCLTPYR
jgi:hypothetical protein